MPEELAAAQKFITTITPCIPQAHRSSGLDTCARGARGACESGLETSYWIGS